MKTLKTLTTLAAGSVAAVAFAGAAQAATISGGSFDFPNSTTEITNTGTLNQFNPSLGTLTSVTFTFNGSYSQEFTATNNSLQNQNANVTTSTSVIFSLEGTGAPTLSPNQLDFSLTTGIQSYIAGETKSFGPFADSDTASVTFTSAAALAYFTGTGTFDSSCFSLSGTNIVGGGGNIDTTQDTLAGCGASVEYTFTEVVEPPQPPATTPEPATLLGLMAFGGAGLVSRRRRQK